MRTFAQRKAQSCASRDLKSIGPRPFPQAHPAPAHPDRTFNGDERETDHADRREASAKPALPPHAFSRIPVFSPPSSVLQAKCACGGRCAACRKEQQTRELLQKKPDHRSDTTADGVPSIVGEVVRSPGQPLDAATRSLMERRFRADFGGVRVHADAKAGDAARSVNALAFTVGRDLVFARHQYSPRSWSGRELIAHELVHVMQQRSLGPVPRTPLTIMGQEDALEQEADRIARGISPTPRGMQELSEPTIQRRVAEPQVSTPQAGAPAESNFIRCFRALMDKCQWRYDVIKEKHRYRPFSQATFDSISSALQEYLDQGIAVECDHANNFFCCGTIASVIVKELPPGERWTRDYGKGYGPTRDDEEGIEGMGEQEVKVNGGSYMIDIVVDMSLEAKDCCEENPPLMT